MGFNSESTETYMWGKYEMDRSKTDIVSQFRKMKDTFSGCICVSLKDYDDLSFSER